FDASKKYAVVCHGRLQYPGCYSASISAARRTSNKLIQGTPIGWQTDQGIAGTCQFTNDALGKRGIPSVSLPISTRSDSTGFSSGSRVRLSQWREPFQKLR